MMVFGCVGFIGVAAGNDGNVFNVTPADTNRNVTIDGSASRHFSPQEAMKIT